MRRAGLFASAALAVAATIIGGMAPAFAETVASVADRPACGTPVVTAPAGRFCGRKITVEDDNRSLVALAYEGIRYGAASRWKAPAAAARSSSVYRATAFGPICPQPKEPGTTQSEDCLFLNLWTPAHAGIGSLPVMVFIHGGAFITGAGSAPIYKGARLAAREKVIIVTLNYRLGALGFLAGGAGADQLAGNYGFEDQQLALAWVRANIDKFGGDPARIAIFGESAGAMSVGAHLVAPGSRGLFEDAIEESNPYGVPFKRSSDAANIRVTFDGTAPVRQCNGKLACLKTLSAATIVAAQAKVARVGQILGGDLGEILAWAPYVDHRLIPSQPNAAAIARPLIAGTNHDEGTLFVYEALGPNGLPDLFYAGLIGKIFGASTAVAILGRPRYARDGKGNLAPLSNLVGDYFFSCATRHVLDAAKGMHFGYAFDHPPSYAVWPGAPAACQPKPKGGGEVCHGLELPFVFRNPVTLTAVARQHVFTAGEQVLVDRISAYWTSLAAAGDPNSTGVPRWPDYGVPGTRQVLDLTIRRTTDTALSCPLWDKIGYGPGAVKLY